MFNKYKLIAGFLLAVMLLSIASCKAEPITTTVIQTQTQTQTQNVTSTVTSVTTVNNTITTTKTFTTTAQPEVTTSKTSSTTTRTSSTTSSATQTVTTTFTPVTSLDGKLMVTTANLFIQGAGYNPNTIAIRGMVRNLTNERVKANVTVEFFGSSGSLGTWNTLIPTILGPGEEKSWVITSGLQDDVSITSFNVSVEAVS